MHAGLYLVANIWNCEPQREDDGQQEESLLNYRLLLAHPPEVLGKEIVVDSRSRTEIKAKTEEAPSPVQKS
ncbi:hypothetical protein EYF80_002675 [Liparis tanakae]|uniref:Uncharacterized protein n=1 Tax=Liparis tanakae TaxID=230148 RepID=A0A4Z2J9Y8_9TELE|nr:hypothetical protein EYF80_002675 [Liparis tanakae]